MSWRDWIPSEAVLDAMVGVKRPSATRLPDPPHFPRPGPQLPARRCEHAASGCNYPEGDCAGLCLVVAPRKAA